MSSGLPSYTLPPAEPATTVAPPFGVSSPGQSRGNFGGSAALPDGRETGSRPEYADDRSDHVWGTSGRQDRDADSPFPGWSSIDMTMPISTNSVDNSGSLTGHILSQGWDQGAEKPRYSKAKVNIAMLVVLLALIGVSLLFLATTGSAFSNWVHGIR